MVMPTTKSGRAAAVLLVVGLARLAGGACGQSPEAKKEKALARGEQYLKAGKLDEAVIEFRTALQVDENFVPAAEGLGRTYLAKSWYGDAARELQRAKKLSPESLPVAVDLGRVLVQLGAWKEAEQEAALILAKDARRQDGLYIRAAALLGEGKPQEVLPLLEPLVPGESSPDLGRTVALALSRLGKISEAEQAFRATLAKNPQDAQSLVGLGSIQLAQNRPAEALKLFEQAKAITPADPKVRQSVAVAQAQLGQLPEAIKELEGIDRRAWSSQTVTTLGALYMRAGRAGDAVRLLTPVVERAPRFALARYLLAQAYLASNDPAPAISQLEEVLRQIPGNVPTSFRLAVAYTRAGRAREALALLDPLGKTLDKTAEYQLARARGPLALGPSGG